MTSTPTHFLDFSDAGTSTPHLFTLYLATKIAWIPRLEKREAVLEHMPSYRPPAWAECIIKLCRYYGTKIRYIRIAAPGDIIILVHIC